MKTLQHQMKVNINIAEIDQIRRVGKPQPSGRLAIVSLTTKRRKMDILPHRKGLQGTNIRLQEDFPTDIVEARKSLYPQMQKLRDQGRRVTMK